MRTLLLMVALVSCDPKNRYAAYQPVRGTTALDRDTATQRAVIAITDAGQEIETSAAGVVLSKWFEGGTGSGGQRFRVRVTVASTGYEVVAMCQMTDAFSGSWGDCPGDGRPQFVVDLVGAVGKALAQ
jgi:hypothetical protein